MTDHPLTNAQAKTALNACLEDGYVVYTKHFREELLNDNLTVEDVLAVCKLGVIRMAPEKDIRTGQWKYRIEGLNTERRSLAVVFCLQPNKTVFITVFERTS